MVKGWFLNGPTVPLWKLCDPSIGFDWLNGEGCRTETG
jgi:hypothetical protein